MKKIFTIALKWLVPICGVTVAVLGVITGQFNLALWALLAAAFSWMADKFRERYEAALLAGYRPEFMKISYLRMLHENEQI